MTELDTLADRFEAHRPHLRGVAYRMLGSLSEADDAVQEAWLRLARTDPADVQNLAGWLTTVVSRLCLDGLRSRAARREDLVGQHQPDRPGGAEPEPEALLVDEVGRALLVVLDTLGPAERIAFVLHDLFAVPFDEIAPVLDRSPATTKKLASRARLRVRGTPAVHPADLRRHRRIVETFLAASRAGDVEAILALLDPDVARRADRFAIPAGRPLQARGAQTVAEEIAVFGARARFAAPALIDGDVGIVVAPRGSLQLALTVRLVGDRIAGYDLIADPDVLSRLDLAVLG
ncbi:MAG TPA: sigma-70 family RNA polymerase sigma factor [Jatrophihabitantaceae bacterium]|jgi:RNA polymerase sigma-70 factor (ECF subfamily)